MHPPRCPYLGNASALRASRGVHNKQAIEQSVRFNSILIILAEIKDENVAKCKS